MNVLVPLGQREDSKLEFKAKDALREPSTIAREVVAFLNSGGGEVWVGLQEKNGIAVTPESVNDAEDQARRLRDFLVDSLEPSPSDRELKIEVVAALGGGSLLRIQCSPQPSRRPYALLKQSGRLFLTRFADRIRTLSREEIRESFSENKNSQEGGIEDLERAVQAELERQRRTASSSGGGFLWLHLECGGAALLDLDKVLESDYLTDPLATGNRFSGSNFTAAYQLGGKEPEIRGGIAGNHLFVGREDVFELHVYGSGRITLRVPLMSLFVNPFEHDEVECQLGSDYLLEYPISLFRLAGRVLADEGLWVDGQAPTKPIVAQFAVLGLEGWGLRPRSVRSSGDLWMYGRQPVKVFKSKDFVLDRPLRFTSEEILTRPDRCGFRLVRQLYMAFGYSLADMPPEFDQRLGRLYLPE